MPAIILDGDTLGKKHQEYNKLLKGLLVNKDTGKLKDVSFDEVDVNNLLQIDVACHNRDVEYILKILKSDDMLYVSKAIQKSIWLITDNQYENIINPDYLQNKLFPEMTTKAYIKLQKSIIHNLCDESRVENFYLKEKCETTAVKWLLGCSVPFIEKNIEEHYKSLSANLLKRFCEKSVSIFKALSKICLNRFLLTSTTFLIYKHTGVYLDALEASSYYERPNLNARATKSIMKYDPERICNKFHIYANIVDLQIFARYMPKENIKSFLYKLAHEELHNGTNNFSRFFRSNKILHIIRQMPKDEQFKFVKEVFIDSIDETEKTNDTDKKDETNKTDEPLALGSELNKIKELRDVVRVKQHVWYGFAPFQIAFDAITNLMQKSSEPNAMLMALIYATNNNLNDIQILLNYYKNNHKDEDICTKRTFIDNLMNHVNVNKFDKQTWSILIEIFKGMNVFEESSEDDQNHIIAIILYHVTHAENVPEIIEKKFQFNTLKSQSKLLNKEEKKDVFNYLCNYLIKKINTHTTISNESEFTDNVELIKQYLHLISDWEEELLDHPLILNKIRELIKIRQKNSWNIDLSSLYNVKKCWRKHMFEESLALCPSEKVCINALKHDPTLLDRYKNEIELMRIDDKVSLQYLLSKLRIYWSQSLATEWTNEYLKHLTVSGNHKAVIRGLCGLLMQKEFLNIVKTYAPKQEKIDWLEIDELTLSLQRHIAKNMHFARPQPSADAILLYAKKDYLSYALPSLLAIFYNMNLNCSRDTFTKLLDARVSLQKHVIRFAFSKLDHKELKDIFSIIWKNTKNATIRCIIFTYTFKLVCNQKEDADTKRYAELLEMFIDNLTSDEDKKIYDHFNSIDKIPLTVRTNILIKFYKNVHRLIETPDKNKNSEYFKKIIDRLAETSRDVMHLMPSEFATELVKNYAVNSFFTHDEYMYVGSGIVNLISAYILSAKDIELQTERYNSVLGPLIKRCLASWNEMRNGKYFIRNKLHCLLTTIRKDLKIYKEKINFEIAYNVFSNIQSEFEPLPVSENYIMLTTWKLTTELTKLLRDTDMSREWYVGCFECAEDFGKICLEYLRNDVKTYFSGIYVLFVKALDNVTEFFTNQGIVQIYEIMLEDKEFIEAYLSIITVFPLNYFAIDQLISDSKVVTKSISTHPSVEVKMHYYYRFKNFVDKI